jgi:hypothetical protein
VKYIFIILVIFNINLYSQIPQLISYQGVLTDNSGNLVSDGSYNLTFNLYTVAVGGSSIWTETQSVTTNQGVFNVNLGSVTQFTIGFSSQYYLGVTIGGTEMSPRTQLTSAAYSMNGNPAGSIIAFGGTSAPTGWLLCDGSAVSRTTYAALFSTIGTAYGSGNGTTTFNLPDFRGRFLRGVDGTANNDPDKATRTTMNAGGNTGNNVGSVQDDAFQGHGHNFWWVCNDLFGGGNSGSWPVNVLGGTPSNGGCQSDDMVVAPVEFSTFGVPRTSTETRPKNANVNYIIKY